MTSTIFRICILAVALASLPGILPAQDARGLEGVWDVTVTVKDCKTGAQLNTLRALQSFGRDGSFSETTFTGTRGPSMGSWSANGQNANAQYWFFRYKADGSFAALAKVSDTVTVKGEQFSASGTVQDYDSRGGLSAGACFEHVGKRLAGPAN